MGNIQEKMKRMKNFTLAIFFLIPFLSYSQEQEKSERRIDLITLQFGVNYADVNHTEGGEFQGRVGLHLRPNLSIGLGAGGFFSSRAYDEFMEEYYIVEGNYGGLIIEPTFFNNSFVYLSFPTMIGGGQVSYIRQDENWDPEGSYFTATDANWLVVPGLQINFSISEYVHFCFLGQYRFAGDMKIEHKGQQLVSSDIANGWSAGIGLKFGHFK